MTSLWASARSRHSAPLAIAIGLSLLAHGVLLHGLKQQAGLAPVHATSPGMLSVRLLSERSASLPPVAWEKAPVANSERRRERASSTNRFSTPPTPDETDSQTALAEAFAPAVLTFNPGIYLRPGDVEIPASPVSPDSLELLQLTGAQPGLWVIRLYIGESGAVDELEIVDARGTETNTLELLGHLRSMRFTPALAAGRPAKSQKMLEFSFEPGPMPLTPTLVPPPAPNPSAAGR